jgi:hypothetical protein
VFVGFGLVCVCVGVCVRACVRACVCVRVTRHLYVDVRSYQGSELAS